MRGVSTNRVVVDWVQQATFEVRETMRKYEILDWILEQRQRVRLWNQRGH